MYNFANFNSEVQKTSEWLKNELGAIRAGRATPQLVEGVRVDYYGSPTPITHAASIIVQDAKTIVIQPWDKSMIPAFEKAILSAALGMSPVIDGDKIRLTLPELTGERRVQLAKLAGEKLEEAKVSIRKSRTETWDDIQEREKKKEMSEDEKFRLKEELQKKVDQAVAQLELLAEKKREEISS